MTHRNALPVRSAPYLRGLEEVRRYVGLTQDRAGGRAGLPRATWCRVVNGRARPGQRVARPLFDTVAAMADGVGMALVLVPKGQAAPREVSAPVPPGRVTRPGPGWELIREACEVTKRVMGQLRTARRESGITHSEMARRIGMGENRLTAIERGDREPRFDDVARYVGELGLTVAFLEPEAAPFANLSREGAEAVRRLVTSYVAHCVRSGTPIPAGLSGAADELKGAA